MLGGKKPRRASLSVRFNERGCGGTDDSGDAARLEIQGVLHTALKQIGRRVNTGQCQPDARFARSDELFQRAKYACRDFIHPTDTSHFLDLRCFGVTGVMPGRVEGDERFGLAVVNIQTLADSFFLVVLALN